MARPDCDDGWIKKACELEAALDFADFPKYCRVILRYVFAQIFGRGNRPDHAIIECGVIASRIGCGRHRRKVIPRALAQLLASGVLVPVEGIEHGFRFIKDYESWMQVERYGNTDRFLTTDRKLIDPDEVADCQAAPDYARTFAIACERPASHPQRGIKRSPTGDHEPTTLIPNGGDLIPNGGSSDPQRGMISAPLNNPLVGTEFQNTESPSPLPPADAPVLGGGEGVENRQIVARTRSEADRIYAVESSCRSDGKLPGPYEPDPAELLRARRFVEAQFPNTSYNLARAMDQHSRQFPSTWWMVAWKRAKLFEASSGKVRTFGLILAWMGEWLDRGGPTSGPWDDYADDMTRLVRPVAAGEMDAKLNFQQRRSAELAELTEGFCLPPRRGASDGIQ